MDFVKSPEMLQKHSGNPDMCRSSKNLRVFTSKVGANKFSDLSISSKQCYMKKEEIQVYSFVLR